LEGECVRWKALLVKDKEALDHLLRVTASEVQVLEEMVANGATTGKAVCAGAAAPSESVSCRNVHLENLTYADVC
jgi:hypothetical protein